jgi:hypothetical protein
MMGVAPDDPDYAAKRTAAVGALDQGLALVESYLDRKLEYLATEHEEIGPERTTRFLLRRYPVESIIAVTVAGAAFPESGYMVNKEAGILFVAGYWSGWPPSSVDYAGGYKDDAWPADLLMVMMEFAASLWPAIYATGAPAPAEVSEPIQRISIPDVGTVEYAAGTGNAATAILGFGQIPAASLAVLDRYRAASVIGGA